MANPTAVQHHRVVIIGAGTGGTAVAARLRRASPGLDIALIDATTDHYYQPAWTLVGGGSYAMAKTRRSVRACLPRGVHHIAHRVTTLEPDANQVTLDDDSRVGYDYLVVAAGIQLNWDAIYGLTETLGRNGVTSNYHQDFAPYTWELVRQFRGGTAIFTQPAGAVKCPGAPQKALYLAADHFRRHGIHADSLQFRSGAASIFGVPMFAEVLNKVLAGYGAEPHYGSVLVGVRGAEKIAVFESRRDGQAVREEVPFDLLHVVPPQSAPDFIRHSALANPGGWLEVNQHSLRHPRYANVFGLGDCTSSPNSKTAAAIKSQAPVLAANLLAVLEGTGEPQSYGGYAACPLTTQRGKVLLAEFSYGGAITPTLPLDPRVPRRFYWWLKASFLPWFYWHILLRGYDLPWIRHPRTFTVNVPSAQV